MLLIERSVDEGFVIGDDTIVRVLKIDSNSVRLAISVAGEGPRYREVELPIPSVPASCTVETGAESRHNFQLTGRSPHNS